MAPLYSHSRLSSFETCPRKFQYRYVLRAPEAGQSIESFLGKQVHEVLERLYRAAGRGLLPPLARVLERFGLLWKEGFDPAQIRIVRAENPPEHYRQNGERWLAEYYRAHYPFDADETVDVEKRVLFDLDEGGHYRMQGIVDRVVRARDGVLEVHDYKTSQRVPSQQALDQDRQLALYQIGVARHYGERGPMPLVWHFLARGQTRRSARSAEQLDALRAETMGVIDRIQRERDFRPRPGPLCRWCEYAPICPASGEKPAETAAAPLPARGQLALF